MRFAERSSGYGERRVLGDKDVHSCASRSTLGNRLMTMPVAFEGRVLSASFDPRSVKGGGSRAELAIRMALVGSSGRGSMVGRAKRYRRFYCPACRGRFASLFALMFHRCSLQRGGRDAPR